jgi:hypothetical protein
MNWTLSRDDVPIGRSPVAKGSQIARWAARFARAARSLDGTDGARTGHGRGTDVERRARTGATWRRIGPGRGIRTETRAIGRRTGGA